MEKYVVDTCVAAKIFINTEKYVDKAVALYDLAYDEKAELVAPSLIWYELGSVFSKMQMPREKSEENFAEFEEQIRMGIIKIIPPSLEVINKADEIANVDTQGQGYISSFDATFHALALLKEAIFITADEKHIRKVQKIKELSDSIQFLGAFPSEHG